MTISYPADSTSHIQWNHVDGPLFCGRDGYIHWLTLWERMLFGVGLMVLEDLEQKYNHNPQKG